MHWLPKPPRRRQVAADQVTAAFGAAVASPVVAAAVRFRWTKLALSFKPYRLLHNPHTLVGHTSYHCSNECRAKRARSSKEDTHG